ncbi:hypothetical protein GCM10023079_04320 [Streptomyces chitinivorans]
MTGAGPGFAEGGVRRGRWGVGGRVRAGGGAGPERTFRTALFTAVAVHRRVERLLAANNA